MKFGIRVGNRAQVFSDSENPFLKAPGTFVFEGISSTCWGRFTSMKCVVVILSKDLVFGSLRVWKINSGQLGDGPPVIQQSGNHGLRSVLDGLLPTGSFWETLFQKSHRWGNTG